MAANAGAGLGPAPGTGAAPGGGAGSSGANSNAVDYATTSDDQILDAGDGDEGEGGAGDAGPGDEYVSIDEGTGEGEGEGQDGEADDTEGEGEGKGDDEEELIDQGEEEDGEEHVDDHDTPAEADDPAEFTKVFKAHPKLRQAFYSDQAYRQVIPTVAEARSYKEIAPTLDDLKAIEQNSKDLEGFDDLFFSQDPKDHEAFFTHMHEQDPQQFATVARSLPTALFQTDPELYREVVATPVVENTLTNMMAHAQKLGLGKDGRGQNLANAIEVLSRSLFGKSFQDISKGRDAQPTPREQKLQRQLDDRTQRDNQQLQTNYKAFHTKASEKAVAAIRDGIKLALLGNKHGLLKDTAYAKNRELTARMVDEIYGKVDAAMKADRGVARELKNLFTEAARKGEFSEDRIEKIVNAIKAKAPGLIKSLAPGVVTTWTKKLLAQNASSQQRQRRAQARVDVTGGAGGGERTAGRPARVSADKVDYSRTSDDDIMNSRVILKKK